MLKKTVITLSFLLAAVAVPAQPSPAKKELVARILKMQQPGIEAMARSLVEQPVTTLLGSAVKVLPTRVPKDKQDAVAKEIQGDVQKYLDEAVPVVQTRAVKLAPSTIGALLEEKFTEDELKQIVSIIESPVYTKFQQMGDDMQNVLVEKLVAETRATIDPKVRNLEQTMAKRLGAPSASSNAPARPASKPAAK
jgi:hypothetical protein